jgi:hypothetical protein
MAIGTISDAEAGSDVRTKLNTAIAAINAGPQRAVISVSALDLADIANTPKSLIAAQGANTVIRVIGGSVTLFFGTVAYDVDNPQIKYATSGASAITGGAADEVNAAEDSYNPDIVSAGNSIPFASAVNLGVVLTADLNPTVGDGTARIILEYIVDSIA